MKKILIGVLAAALMAIPATAFAAQVKPAKVIPATAQTTDFNDCCIEFTAPCCNVQPAVQQGAGCCFR